MQWLFRIGCCLLFGCENHSVGFSVLTKSPFTIKLLPASISMV